MNFLSLRNMFKTEFYPVGDELDANELSTNVSNSDLSLIANLLIKETQKTTFQIVFKDNVNNLNAYFTNSKDVSRSTFLIELNERKWVALQIYNNCQGNRKVAYYYDPLNFSLNHKFKVPLKDFSIKLVTLPLAQISSCDLFGTLFMAKKFAECISELDDNFEFLNDSKEMENFKIEVVSIAKELIKLKCKLTVFFNILSKLLRNGMPVVCSHKYANIFLYIIDTLSLRGNAVNNNELKDYVTEYAIGESNMTIVNNIWIAIIGRKTTTKIFPHEINVNIFKNSNTYNAYKCMMDFINEILHCLNSVDKTIRNNFDLKTVLGEPEEFSEIKNNKHRIFGCKIDKNDTLEVLQELSSSYYKEILSYEKVKNPDKFLFEYFFNFIPLMNILYEKKQEDINLFAEKGFQLLSNIYLMNIQDNKSFPSIIFKRMLTELELNFFNFYLACKYSNIISQNPKPDKLKEELTQSFKSSRTKLKASNINLKVTKFYDLEIDQSVKIYLKTMLWVDYSNKIILNVNDNTMTYDKFDNNQRANLFEFMIFLYQSNKYFKSESNEDQGTYAYDLISMNIQLYLKSAYGLPEKDFEIMYASLTRGFFEKNKENAKLLDTISTYFKNNPLNFKRKYPYSKKGLDKIWNIEIANKLIKMKESNIIQNINSVLHIVPKKLNYIPATVEKLFSQKLFLKYLAAGNLDVDNINPAMEVIPFLRPLVSVLFTLEKIKLNRDNEINFLKDCIREFIKKSYTSEHLSDLISFQIARKDYSYLNLCFNAILQEIENISFQTIIPLFENTEFELMSANALKIYLTSDSRKTKHLNLSMYKILGKHLLDFKYISAIKCYKTGNYMEALKFIDGDNGLMSIMNRLLSIKYFSKNSLYVKKRKLLIVWVKLKLGQSYQRSDYPFKAQFKDALVILNELLIQKENDLPWSLKINGLIAHTNCLLKDHQKSKQIYETMLQKLYQIVTPPVLDPVLNKTEFNELINSPDYKKAISMNPTYLNIFQLMNFLATEYINLGYCSKNKKQRSYYYCKGLTEFEKANDVQEFYLGKDNPLFTYSEKQLQRIRIQIRKTES